jgi:hypothetical protein
MARRDGWSFELNMTTPAARPTVTARPEWGTALRDGLAALTVGADTIILRHGDLPRDAIRPHRRFAASVEVDAEAWAEAVRRRDEGVARARAERDVELRARAAVQVPADAEAAYDRYRSDWRRADAAGDHAAAALLRRYGKSITAKRKLAALMTHGG